MDNQSTQHKTYNKTILVVEDEPAMLAALHDKFTLSGFYVLKAGNGTDGLDVAEKEHPDLVILDVIMPSKDGITMMKEMRSKDGLEAVPIIILSNLNPNDEVSYLVERCQPAYYLIKSETKLEDLLNKVKSILRIT